MNDALQIDNNDFNQLMDEFQELSTFAEVKQWGERAGTEMERLTGILRGLDIEIARDSQTLDRIKYEKSKKALGRLFSGGSEEKELTRRLEQYRESKTELAKTVTQLQESIDFTPKSLEEQKGLLVELRQHKKELQDKKREITSVIRGPRGLQQQSAQENTVFDVATIARRKARYTREAEVLPQERSSDAINRQLAQTDRDIQWVEKFTQ